MLLLKSILQKNIWQTFEKKLEVLSQIFNIFNCIFYALIFFFFFFKLFLICQKIFKIMLLLKDILDN